MVIGVNDHYLAHVVALAFFDELHAFIDEGDVVDGGDIMIVRHFQAQDADDCMGARVGGVEGKKGARRRAQFKHFKKIKYAQGPLPLRPRPHASPPAW
jgi:hypothetical protein